MTARVCATTMRRNRGTRRIPRAVRTAVAARPTCAAPAATACCSASRRIDLVHAGADAHASRLAPPLPVAERSDRDAIGVEGLKLIAGSLPPHPNPLPNNGERERA